MQTITVIIPALNEAANIAGAVGSAVSAGDVEIIVADGGSDDDTARLAEAAGARVLILDPCRATQMNAGARAASGDILLFLHADTFLPVHWEDHVRAILANPVNSAGAFKLFIDSDSRAIRRVARTTNRRSRRLQLPYGDQALFMTASIFHRLGGFPDVPLMEDFEMVRRLRRHGRIALADAAVTTSARRWERVGPIRSTILNQVIVIGYLLGISPTRLSRWYRGIGSPGKRHLS